MVIRDLTLRSAASFGSFHLIRLLYDEYMFYLVEHRVAQATGETPIAVMGEVRKKLFQISWITQVIFKVVILLINSLSSLDSQFSDLNSMMPSLMEKGKPIIYAVNVYIRLVLSEPTGKTNPLVHLSIFSDIFSQFVTPST